MIIRFNQQRVRHDVADDEGQFFIVMQTKDFSDQAVSSRTHIYVGDSEGRPLCFLTEQAFRDEYTALRVMTCEGIEIAPDMEACALRCVSAGVAEVVSAWRTPRRR